MNSVAFLLRNKLSENRFSDAVLDVLNVSKVDSALLCSGFFQEDKSYSVSCNQFSRIYRCCNKLNLATVGYYAGTKTAYTKFLNNIRRGLCPICVKVSSYRIPGDKWHAKVFIAKAKGVPVMAAIGSSNMTRRAFDSFKNFNYECDVIFWDETDPEINRIMTGALGEQPDDFLSTVVARVDENSPLNKVPVKNRLAALEKEIMAKAVVY